jgi:SAM-dependent methyltransferase
MRIAARVQAKEPSGPRSTRTRTSAPNDDPPDKCPRENGISAALASRPVSSNRWIALTEQNSGHSSWYVERFRSMAAAGEDLDGEARLVDAMVARRSRVLDAGCGPGRVGGYLARLGHDVVGVDIDPVLIAAAKHDHPAPTWLVMDLAELDLAAMGVDEGFDVVVCAGNVMTFLDPHTRQRVLERLVAHLREGGRLVIGFGSGREYSFSEFFNDVEAAELVTDVLLSTWDLRPFTADSDFLVAVLSRRPRPTDRGAQVPA